MAITLKVTLAFFLMVVVDVMWAIYIRRAGQGKAFSAAAFSMFIMLSGAFVAIGYIENHWLIIPTAVGAFVGTFISVKVDHRKVLA